MKQITAEWVAKAEADFATMERECQVTDNPNCDGICFHAQQCAEKYLKASLCEAGVSFGKIHDLVALLEYVLELEPSWEQFREDLAYLSAFAVSYRYPGMPLIETVPRMGSRGVGSFAERQESHLDWRPKIKTRCRFL